MRGDDQGCDGNNRRVPNLSMGLSGKSHCLSHLIWYSGKRLRGEGINRVNKTLRKLMASAAAVLTLTLIGTQAAPTFAATTSSPAKTLVALGDSITFGYNLSDTKGNTVPSQYAFPVLIGQKEGLKVTDLGIPGWTSGDLLNALHSADFLTAIHGASVITLDIGSNDLLRWAAENGILADATGSSTPTLTATQQEQVAGIIAQFGKNFAATVGLIRLVSDAPIVVYNLYDPFPSISPLHAITEPLQAVENHEIDVISQLYKNVSVADAHAAFAGNQLVDVRVLEGDVHPTVQGQSVLAAIGEQALAPMLSKEARPNAFSGVTDLLAGAIAPTGGSMSGTVNTDKITLTAPAGAINQGTEVAVTSQESAQPGQPTQNGQSGPMGLPLGLGSPTAEVAVNFMQGTKWTMPYSLTIDNAGITKNSLVFALTGTSFEFIGSAHISPGQVTVTGQRAEEFIVLSLPAWL